MGRLHGLMGRLHGLPWFLGLLGRLCSLFRRPCSLLGRLCSLLCLLGWLCGHGGLLFILFEHPLGEKNKCIGQSLHSAVFFSRLRRIGVRRFPLDLVRHRSLGPRRRDRRRLAPLSHPHLAHSHPAHTHGKHSHLAHTHLGAPEAAWAAWAAWAPEA